MRLRHFMIVYVGFLLIFSSFWLDDPLRILKGLFIVVIYCGLDLIWGYFQNHQWKIPTSSIISSLILATVGLPNPPWIMVISLPVLAILSKHLLFFGKSRHIFNPAAFALVIFSLYQPAVAWWAMSWGKIPLVLVILAGLFILWKLRRFHITFSFLISYALLLTLHLETWNFSYLVDGTTLFFASVMLIEPVTASFSKKIHGVIYGVFVAFVAVMSNKFGFENLDPLLFGLLLGNFVISMICLSWKKSTS